MWEKLRKICSEIEVLMEPMIWREANKNWLNKQ